MCWFGPHDIKKNKVIQRCINSWHIHMSNYIIMEWTEANINIKDLPPFAQNAYKNKKWAYVADVVRFQKLYEYGGVYLDTDMLMLKNPDFLFSQKKENQDNNDISIWGMEDAIHVSCGIIAANKNNKLIKNLYNFYADYYNNKNLNEIIAVPKIVSKTITQMSEEERKKSLVIYGSEYFYSLSNAHKKEDYKKYITDKSVAVHLWNYSWQPLYIKVLSSVGIVQIGKAILRGNLRIIFKRILRLG